MFKLTCGQSVSKMFNYLIKINLYLDLDLSTELTFIYVVVLIDKDGQTRKAFSLTLL